MIDNTKQMKLEYELELTKRILQKIIEMNEGKDIKMPDASDMDQIQDEVRIALEDKHPNFKIEKSKK